MFGLHLVKTILIRYYFNQVFDHVRRDGGEAMDAGTVDLCVDNVHLDAKYYKALADFIRRF